MGWPTDDDEADAGDHDPLGAAHPVLVGEHLGTDGRGEQGSRRQQAPAPPEALADESTVALAGHDPEADGDRRPSGTQEAGRPSAGCSGRASILAEPAHVWGRKG